MLDYQAASVRAAALDVKCAIRLVHLADGAGLTRPAQRGRCDRQRSAMVRFAAAIAAWRIDRPAPNLRLDGKRRESRTDERGHNKNHLHELRSFLSLSQYSSRFLISRSKPRSG